MKHTTASEVAKLFIATFQKKNAEISNLKLQKLIYYSQAWNLALYSRPLFEERIEAWVHGPVVPGVFREYKMFGWKPIPAQDASRISSEAIKDHLRKICRVYGKFDAVALEQMTHREDPWKQARQGLAPDEPSHRVITHSAMEKYYGARLIG